jgi:hypothetical protein
MDFVCKEKRVSQLVWSPKHRFASNSRKSPMSHHGTQSTRALKLSHISRESILGADFKQLYDDLKPSNTTRSRDYLSWVTSDKDQLTLP